LVREESALNKHIASIRTSGTILPSSRFLVKRLADGVDFENARFIAELGVGDGCVTRELLRRMRPDARLVSLEINPVFVEEGRRIPDSRLTVVQACATDLPRILREEGIGGVDAVVSSLPLSIMDAEVVDRVLENSRASLRDEGRFVQYQYSLSNHDRLSRGYRDVAVGFTMLNVPPAFVFTCSHSTLGEGTKRRARRSFGSLYAAALAAVAFAIRAYQQL
jgi:phospholipid N-methyltransferase